MVYTVCSWLFVRFGRITEFTLASFLIIILILEIIPLAATGLAFHVFQGCQIVDVFAGAQPFSFKSLILPRPPLLLYW